MRNEAKLGGEAIVPYNEVDFLLLAPEDNVLISRRAIDAGQQYLVDGKTMMASVRIDVGFKVARHPIQMGEKVIKYGAPIGSATQDLSSGELVHLHNMKSDYLPTYTHEQKTFTNRGEDS